MCFLCLRTVNRLGPYLWTRTTFKIHLRKVEEIFGFFVCSLLVAAESPHLNEPLQYPPASQTSFVDLLMEWYFRLTN